MEKIFVLSLFLSALCLLPTARSMSRESNFSLLNFCDVTVTPFDVLKWPRSVVQCAVQCAGSDTLCSAFVYDAESIGCALYSQNPDIQQTCQGGDAGSLGFYILGSQQQYQNPCLNNGSLNQNGDCVCVNGYVGTFCERLMEDCSDGYNFGNYRVSGEYWMQPRLASAPFRGTCQMEYGFGVLKIMGRGSLNVSFNRTWQEYKDGFVVNPGRDLYLGNEKIHWVTASNPQRLIITLTNKTVTYQRYHVNFRMANESQDFAVSYTSGYSSPDQFMEECWPANVSIKFSTYDNDNDGHPDNCASRFGAGFWFRSLDCAQCNPNGDITFSSFRLGVDNENFWTPTLGDWSPNAAGMFLVQV